MPDQHAPPPAPIEDGPVPLTELRDRIRLGLERQTRAMLDRVDVEPQDAYALAALALSYTRLGGDLELAPGTADAGALEAEVRLVELEAAIDRVAAALALDGSTSFLLDPGSRLEPLGLALADLIEARAR